MILEKKYRHMVLRLIPGLVCMLATIIVLAGSSASAGTGPDQKTFTTPQQAVAALISAVMQANDSALLAVLGAKAADLISSGDKVADQRGRTRFLQAYNEKNSLEQEADGRVVLMVGTSDYPFSIPVVRQGDAWFFDTPAGEDEILNRRIGRNELHTIEVRHAYTAAQREYARKQHNGRGTEFAQRFASTTEKRDGLYWPTDPGEEESPFGPLIARATAEGYAHGLDEDLPEPFHGYYFKILTGQGAHATGGAFNYVVDGKMVLGFALVAYPAKYGVSGIMTFSTNQEGIIYEKDLGPETDEVASAITVFDPDNTWHQYERPAEP
ncbi:MAG: DUF2950 domain-containing protein [Desulfobulbales bacterium]